MTKAVLLTRIAAILSTLAEAGGSPESMLYIFCDMNMEDWQTIRSMMLRAGLVSIKSHFVTLTALGRETAREIDATIKRGVEGAA